MKVLHLLAGGNVGGIENLCEDYALFSKHENIFLFLWEGGPVADEMKKMSCKIIEAKSGKKNFLYCLRLLSKLCKEEAINAVIVHHAAPLLHFFLMYLKIRFPQIGTIAYAHGNAVDMCREKEKKGLWLRKTIIAQSLKFSDVTVAISSSVKNSLIEYLKIPYEKIRIIYNGTNIDKFILSNKINKTKIQFIYVGRLIEEKGVQISLQILSLLDKRIDYSFQIIGDGPYRRTLESLVEELHLDQRVAFLGNRRDVPQLLSQADIFLHMPVWEEGFGITIIEALAAGVVCICANKGAIPEIIIDADNGFLVNEQDIKGCALKIEKICFDISSESMQLVKKNAHNSAIKKFSVNSFSQTLDMLIDEKCYYMEVKNGRNGRLE